jgi:hypothetical protein
MLQDFTQSNVRYWERQSSLREYVDSGLLDFATFDAENDAELVLRRSGEVISSDTVK